MKAVILCGGAGTRLWPISRQSSPKQFAPIFNGKSLFQLTIERNLPHVDGLIVVVNEKQLSLCQSQIPQEIASQTDFIIEPTGRNTAPAIALAALLTEDNLLVLPSDHLIKDLEQYKNSIQKAHEYSQLNNLVTFGIKPTYPETGYGYIEAKGHDVESFKEKPELDIAQKYIESGNYYWNSGMFCFQSTTYLNELKNYRNDIYSTAKVAFDNANVNERIYRIDLNQMKEIPSESIDYAVMEKSQIVKIVPSDIAWSDLGSFDSLYDELDKDDNGNTFSSNYIQHNSKNNLILSNKRIITTFDVEDLLIVETQDSILIGKKGESQNVKKIVESLKVNHQHLLD